MYKTIKEHCNELVTQFDKISEDRKKILHQISRYIQEKLDQNLPARLIYVCTHNSRRSHFGQIWSAAAADYYAIPNVFTYSGGTETTAFNQNAIEALRASGFIITVEEDGANPKYAVHFGEGRSTICYSKRYNDEANPESGFAAIMTCSDAEDNCPFIPGVELRIATTYDDPKAFDGTLEQKAKYLERSNQIALESLYVFSKIHSRYSS
ncbi:MAG: protein-tyrosine-phosphatase [Bacteroidota bacterium]